MKTCICNPYAESGPVPREPNCPIHGVGVQKAISAMTVEELRREVAESRKERDKWPEECRRLRAWLERIRTSAKRITDSPNRAFLDYAIGVRDDAKAALEGVVLDE